MIDFGPFIDELFALLGAVLTSVAVYYARKAGKRYDWLDADDAAETVETYIDKGLRVIRGQLDDKHDISDDETINKVVQWVSDHAPKALEKAELTPDDVRGMVRDWLRDDG